MLYYNKTTNELQSSPPWGEGWVHDDIITTLYADWAIVNDNFIPPVPLDKAKQEKTNKINAHRNQLEQAGFSYLNKILQSDAISVQRIAVAVQSAQVAIANSQDFSIDWTCADNSILTLNAQQVLGMPVALAQYSNQLHQHATALKLQVKSASTVEEVETIPIW